MRILVLTSVYPPLGYSGHDVRCRQTVQTLAARGHHLQVMTSDYRLPPMGVPGEKGVFRELRLYPPSEANSLLGQSYKATYAHERFNAEALEYRIRRFKPDTVYVWNMHGLSKSLLFRLSKKKLRIMYDIHSDWLSPEQFNRDPWLRWWFDNSSKRSRAYRGTARVLGRAKRVLGTLPIGRADSLNLGDSYIVSEWLRDRLREAGITQVEALPMIYPAVEPKKLILKTSYKARQNFVWAGRLSQAKAADIAVDVVGLLKGRGVDVALDIFALGEPGERKALHGHIEAAGLTDRVRMRGIRPGELTEHYAHYDALLYTNRYGEPFSMTVLEAAMSKLPCIMADVGGNRELLENAKDALLFTGGDAEALADAIVAFIERKDAGRDLAEHSYERLQATQTIDVFCDQLEVRFGLQCNSRHVVE